MAGKKGENARSNRIRFIMLDADLGDGNLTELTGAITQALRPIHPAPKPVQQIAARRVEDDANEATHAQATSEEQEIEETVGKGAAAKPSGGACKYKPPIPAYMPDLDMTGFKDYAAQRNPKLASKRFLNVALWLRDQGKADAITTAHVYTAYRTAGWPTNIRDWDGPLRQLVKQDWMRRVKTGAYALTPLGEAQAAKGTQ